MTAANEAGSRVTVRDVVVPSLLYGTAWKEERTAELVEQAIRVGFRGIDTANQRRHYFEAAVGQGLLKAFEAGVVRRKDLFLQTKFTYAHGQDHRLPYDPRAPAPKQVEASFESSLDHLGVDRLDAYLLHGPATGMGLIETDWQTWRAMEALQRQGKTRFVGVSNVSLPQLEALWSGAEIKPALVQNRTFTRPESDIGVRRFCQLHGVGYEGFSLLTARRDLLSHPDVVRIAEGRGWTSAQTILRYCLEGSMIVLTGTTRREHMEQDLAIRSAAMAADEIETLGRILG